MFEVCPPRADDHGTRLIGLRVLARLAPLPSGQVADAPEAPRDAAGDISRHHGLRRKFKVRLLKPSVQRSDGNVISCSNAARLHHAFGRIVVTQFGITRKGFCNWHITAPFIRAHALVRLTMNAGPNESLNPLRQSPECRAASALMRDHPRLSHLSIRETLAQVRTGNAE